jgi:hypothetical protein
MLKFLIILILLAGCNTATNKIYSTKFETVYNWSIYPKNPYCLYSNPPVIYIDTHYLNKYNVWPHLSEVVRHEEYHGLGLKTHCDNASCLMYKEIVIWPVRIFDKHLCKDCQGKI